MSARRSGPATARDEPAVADLVPQPAQVVDARQAQQRARVDLDLAPTPSSSRSIPARCSRSHGTPVNCTAWVTSWKTTQRQELLGSTSSRRAASCEVRGDEQQPRALASGRAARARTGRARGGPGSRRSRRPRPRGACRPRHRSGAGERAHAARRAAATTRVERAAHRARGWPAIQAARPTASGGGSVAGGLEARVRDDARRARLAPSRRGRRAAASRSRRWARRRRRPRRARRGSSRSRVGRPLEVGCGQRGELGERRLGARRDDRRARLEVERRGERVVARRERDDAAALADDQLRRPRRRPRGSSTARPSRRRAPPRPGTARSRSSRSRAAAGDVDERVRRRARPSAGRPTRSRPARACRRGVRRSGGGASSSDAVEPRARRRATRAPLLARPEVVDEAEGDVGHRRPVGDGDRERVVRQPALGVQRAVDRVDDDAHVAGRRSRRSPRSSRHAVKRAPSRVQRARARRRRRPRPRRR